MKTTTVRQSIAVLGVLLGGALSVACAVRPTVPADTWNELPAHLLEDIDFGQTRRAEGMRGFRFKAPAGRHVTITVRSAGPDTSVHLYHASRSRLGDTANVIAFDVPAMKALGMFDRNGPHSEIVTTLPPDDDAVYFVWVSVLQGSYTVTLSAGKTPADDICHLRKPIPGNTGKYMSPFTEDGTVAPWVEKGMAAAVGASVGRAVGSFAAQGKNSSSFVAAVAGSVIGDGVGRQVAIQAAGGWAFIKANSNQSFDALIDLARYLHHRHADHPQYADVLEAAYGVYPDLRQSMERAQAGY